MLLNVDISDLITDKDCIIELPYLSSIISQQEHMFDIDNII